MTNKEKNWCSNISLYPFSPQFERHIYNLIIDNFNEFDENLMTISIGVDKSISYNKLIEIENDSSISIDQKSKILKPIFEIRKILENRNGWIIAEPKVNFNDGKNVDTSSIFGFIYITKFGVKDRLSFWLRRNQKDIEKNWLFKTLISDNVFTDIINNFLRNYFLEKKQDIFKPLFLATAFNGDFHNYFATNSKFEYLFSYYGFFHDFVEKEMTKSSLGVDGIVLTNYFNTSKNKFLFKEQIFEKGTKEYIQDIKNTTYKDKVEYTQFDKFQILDKSIIGNYFLTNSSDEKQFIKLDGREINYSLESYNVILCDNVKRFCNEVLNIKFKRGSIKGINEKNDIRLRIIYHVSDCNFQIIIFVDTKLKCSFYVKDFEQLFENKQWIITNKEDLFYMNSFLENDLTIISADRKSGSSSYVKQLINKIQLDKSVSIRSMKNEADQNDNKNNEKYNSILTNRLFKFTNSSDLITDLFIYLITSKNKQNKFKKSKYFSGRKIKRIWNFKFTQSILIALYATVPIMFSLFVKFLTDSLSSSWDNHITTAFTWITFGIFSLVLLFSPISWLLFPNSEIAKISRLNLLYFLFERKPFKKNNVKYTDIYVIDGINSNNIEDFKKVISNFNIFKSKRINFVLIISDNNFIELEKEVKLCIDKISSLNNGRKKVIYESRFFSVSNNEKKLFAHNYFFKDIYLKNRTYIINHYNNKQQWNLQKVEETQEANNIGQIYRLHKNDSSKFLCSYEIPEYDSMIVDECFQIIDEFCEISFNYTQLEKFFHKLVYELLLIKTDKSSNKEDVNSAITINITKLLNIVILKIISNNIYAILITKKQSVDNLVGEEQKIYSLHKELINNLVRKILGDEND
ncbi:MAG: hypothetical protein ACRC4L_00825 [Mycoplasma sp.]